MSDETSSGDDATTTLSSSLEDVTLYPDPASNEREHSLSHVVPVYVITCVFGAIFIIFPMLIRRGPNKAMIRTCIMLTAACCWIFYLTTYIVQMNPLLGPRMTNVSLAWIGYKWGNDPKTLTSLKTPSESDAIKPDPPDEASNSSISPSPADGPPPTDGRLSDDSSPPSERLGKLGIDARTEAITATAIVAANRLAQEPATEEVSLDESPPEEPSPAEPLPAESPPAEPPPAEMPPAELPPVDVTPKELSPIELPPLELPPIELPPPELPPIELPPVEPLPAESPPAEPSPEERLPSELLPETGAGDDDDGRI